MSHATMPIEVITRLLEADQANRTAQIKRERPQNDAPHRISPEALLEATRRLAVASERRWSEHASEAWGKKWGLSE